MLQKSENMPISSIVEEPKTSHCAVILLLNTIVPSLLEYIELSGIKE